MSRDSHGWKTTQPPGGSAPASRDGIALLSVVLIIALLGLMAVPMLEVTRTTQERAIKQQLLTLLNKEAKEYLEIGIYAVQTTGGVPKSFTRTQSAKLRKLAEICDRRVRTIDPEMLGTARLNDNATVYNSQVTTAKNRQVAQFIVDKTTQGDNYKRFALVSCATAQDGSLGVYGAEIASMNRSFYTLKFGQF
jgi:type II secretory pathway pseudopilin PulG